MQIGIFAKTFTRPNVEDVFYAIHSEGLTQTQFNMSCAGLASMPDTISPDLSDRIKAAAVKNGVAITAVSGTFNMIHPDFKERLIGLKRLDELAKACSRMGTSVITLCTGSRNETSMWKKHPDNNSPDAWNDLCVSMAAALRIAQDRGITLAIEPEVSNVIDSAIKARRFLDEMKSQNLKIIMDGANLFHSGEAKNMTAILNNAFELLAGDIVIAHAKDLANDGDNPEFVAAGKGMLDYKTYLKLLKECNYQGSLILHGLSEAQVPESVGFIRKQLEQLEVEG